MKQVANFSISIYQYVLSPLLKQIMGVPVMCRYQPSCSEYARRVITKYGIVKGVLLTTRRLLSCQPFGRYSTHEPIHRI